MDSTNGTQRVSWTAEPSGRGTWGILSSCMITMALCVYTALHLNIPHRCCRLTTTSLFRRIWQSEYRAQGQWLLMGLFAPELVVYTAWSQFIFVRNITQVISRRGPETQVHTHGVWTIYHSWYLLMRGFVFDTTPPEGRDEYVVGSPKLVLTRIGLNYMMDQRIGNLPALKAEEIGDFGKADSVAKGLVCFQAAFIVVQSIARCVRRLPVSLLEINTVGHAMCALLMYCFWFKKPKDVKTQTVIDFKGAHDLAAFLYFGSSFNESICPGAPDSARFLYGRDPEDSARSVDMQEMLPHEARLNRVQHTSTVREVSRFAEIIERIERLEHSQQRHRQEEQRRGKTTRRGPKDLLKAADPLRRRECGCLLDAKKMLRRSERQIDPERLLQPSHCDRSRGPRLLLTMFGNFCRDMQLAFQQAIEGPAYDWNGERGVAYSFSPSALTRLEMTANYIDSRLVRMEHIDARDQVCANPSDTFNVNNGVALEAPNWPTQVGFRGSSVVPLLGMAFVMVCYGGFHTVALIEVFPSKLERHLWIASCICLASSGIVVSAYALMREAWKRRPPTSDKSDALGTPAIHDQKLLARFTSWLFGFLFATLESSGRHFFFVRKVGAEWKTHHIPALIVRIVVWLGALAAIASRIFIVVKAFISLRRMPARMYETPDWPNWIPHL